MFQSFAIKDGVLIDCLVSDLPYLIRGVGGSTLNFEQDKSHIGMVASGAVRVVDEHGEYRLGAGTYFCVRRGKVEPMTVDAKALVITVPFYAGLRQFGGPLEPIGRLQYVDGCSDTLLLAPSRKGEPCLNHLHLPANVPQRRHYHPSDRAGLILRGTGVCHTDNGSFELSPGEGWHIPAGMNHHFETKRESMDVIAWHPDSDFGPTDEDHPMINRTWTR